MKRSQLCGAWDTRSLDFMTQEVSLCTMLPICWISFSLTSTNWTTNPGYSAGNYTWLFAITCLEATIFPALQFEAYLHFTCSFKIRLFFSVVFFNYYYFLAYFAFHQNLKPCLHPILAHILKWIQASNFPSFCLRRVWYLQSFLSHFVLGEPTATHTRRRKIRSALSPWEVPARAC